MREFFTTTPFGAGVYVCETDELYYKVSVVKNLKGVSEERAKQVLREQADASGKQPLIIAERALAKIFGDSMSRALLKMCNPDCYTWVHTEPLVLWSVECRSGQKYMIAECGYCILDFPKFLPEDEVITDIYLRTPDFNPWFLHVDGVTYRFREELDSLVIEAWDVLRQGGQCFHYCHKIWRDDDIEKYHARHYTIGRS